MADEKKAAFGQYTTGRKYQGAKKRAEKPSDVNLIKDPKTYAAVMGLLGERPDEMGFSALHPDYEAIRRVADPAFAIGTTLGIAPGVSLAQKAATKGALALGRAGEQMAERAVPQIMGRGGLGADILSGLAQGTQSRIFIGPKAKTWNQSRADMAVAMEEAGRTPQEIWLATGTFRGKDGILRQEIDDRAAKFLSPSERQERIDSAKGKIAEMKEKIKPTPQKDLFPKALTEAKKEVRDDISILKSDVKQRENNPRTQGLLAQHIFEHPELYKAYPELQNVKFVTEGGNGGTLGALSIVPSKGFYPGSMEIDIYDKGLRSNPTSTSLHEMQHAVQTLEGMGPGGNPTFAFSNPEAHEILKRRLDQIRSPGTFEEFQRANRFPEDKAREAYDEYVRTYKPFINPKIERDVQEQAAMEYYKRLLGEAEARAVQDRQLMTKSQRMETPPPASYDVPQEDLIVKPPREYAEGGKAAFGVFPQMKPRRSKQDREAAKNVPVDLARGVISGALGIPGDIESLARLPYELITGNESPTILPTSEDIEKRLPFKSDTPVGGVATGLGQIAGGFATPAPAIRAAKKLRQTIGNLPPANPRMSQMGVIKAPGGNWLSGSVESAIKPLKTNRPTHRDEALVLGGRWAQDADTPEGIRAMAESAAINNWVDRNLTNYIKKQMATPEDPVRRLAEEGIVHIPSEQVGVNRYRAPKHREAYGGEQLGKSEAARAWEDASDVAINAPTASTIRANESLYQANPWTEKLSPEDRVYALNRPASTQHEISGLGFDHIIDVLREDLATGRIRPEQLNKVSMEQAVRRTYEYDQEMAKKMREAQIKATEGMPIYKEYPEGYKWMELTTPKGLKLPEGYSIKPDPITNRKTGVVDTNSYRLVDPDGKLVGWGKTEEEAVSSGLGKKVLENALKYEGETMGHCVGGYCPDVMEGRSRIFSLRDAKGEPHVTVEVEPRAIRTWDDVTAAVGPQEAQKLWKEFDDVGGFKMSNVDEGFDIFIKQKGIQPIERIAQIKGKQNRAPKEEYLPFVQDFVRGGQWSNVGDLQNTGLRRFSDAFNENEIKKIKDAGIEVPTWATPDEIKTIGDAVWPGQYGTPPGGTPEGMAGGGRVRFTDNPDAMRLELQMAAGGIAKRMAKTIGKAAESAGQKPPTVAAKDLTTLQDTHTMLGDKVRARAMEAQKQMDEWNYKYSPGQHVFTQHGASKNLPPLRILERARSGNQVMRQDHPEFGPGMGKPIIDPATGKAMRTPYEPGYRVRRQNSPDPEDYAEFIIPEKSIVGDVEMAAGGIARGLKGLAKGMKKDPAVPVDIPRVRPTPQAIEQAAERVARQQLGEHVRSPVLDDTTNLAGRSMKESQRLQNLEYKLTPTKELPPVQTYEQKIGDVNIALPGDQTVADMILESIEDIPIGSVQEGGAFYGLGKLADPEEYRAFWASNESAAQNFQNKVNEIAKQFDTDQVTAHHLAMGTTSNNFAMHFADANLRAIDYSKLNRRDMETFDRAIADGYTKKNQKTGEYEHISFPNWPGIADPEGAKLAMRADPELRKWFNNRMKVPKLTQATNMPDGRSIQWAITEPLIRNSEINLTGLSVGRMKPGAELIPGSKHQTYSHDIAGTALGKAQELAPFEISFPDVTSFVREQYRPQDFTGTIQKVFPHQVVDEAYLEDLNKYYQRLRQIRGFNKGGAVHKAAGGEISADDLIIEERPL